MTRSRSDARTRGQRMLAGIAARTSPPPPYVLRLGLEITALEWREGFVAVDLDVRPDFCVDRDIVFGGYLAGLHDQAAGFALHSCLPDDRLFATTKLDVDFRAPTRPGPVRAVAEVGSVDDRVARVRVRVEQAGKLTSESTVAEALFPARSRW